jgi:hypothetical protein
MWQCGRVHDRACQESGSETLKLMRMDIVCKVEVGMGSVHWKGKMEEYLLTSMHGPSASSHYVVNGGSALKCLHWKLQQSCGFCECDWCYGTQLQYFSRGYENGQKRFSFIVLTILNASVISLWGHFWEWLACKGSYSLGTGNELNPFDIELWLAIITSRLSLSAWLQMEVVGLQRIALKDFIYVLTRTNFKIILLLRRLWCRSLCAHGPNSIIQLHYWKYICCDSFWCTVLSVLRV